MITVLWALALAVLLPLLMVSHMIPLPSPSHPRSRVSFQSPTLSTSGNGAGERDISTGHWTAMHILVAGCQCSRFTAESLAARKPSTQFRETVVVVGGISPWEKALAQSGFDVRHKDAAQVASDTGIEGGPWLILLSPEGKIAYSGGYAAQRPRPGVILQDLNIMRAAFSGQTLPKYPPYGCAGVLSLRRRLDPLGLCQITQ